jgi:hypothetical protein
MVAASASVVAVAAAALLLLLLLLLPLLLLLLLPLSPPLLSVRSADRHMPPLRFPLLLPLLQHWPLQLRLQHRAAFE